MSTDTQSSTAVIEAIEAHHRELAVQVAARAVAVRDAAERLLGATGARDELVSYLQAEVLPHAAAEEKTLYAAAQLLTPTQLLVRSMIDEHRLLERLVADLGAARTAPEMVGLAASVRTLFEAHLVKENEILLPALQTAGLDLHSMLEGMHEILGHSEGDAEAGEAAGSQHGGCGCGGCGCGSQTESAGVAVLDVRTLPHGLRHEQIFRWIDALPVGEFFVLVNDHDPKPLRYQLEAQRPGEISWTYLAEGPEVWQVQIGRL